MNNNIKISPLYQAIRDPKGAECTIGDPSAKLFERTLKWLNWLKKIYEEKEEESDIIWEAKTSA